MRFLGFLGLKEGTELVIELDGWVEDDDDWVVNGFIKGWVELDGGWKRDGGWLELDGGGEKADSFHSNSSLFIDSLITC